MEITIRYLPSVPEDRLLLEVSSVEHRFYFGGKLVRRQDGYWTPSGFWESAADVNDWSLGTQAGWPRTDLDSAIAFLLKWLDEKLELRGLTHEA